MVVALALGGGTGLLIAGGDDEKDGATPTTTAAESTVALNEPPPDFVQGLPFTEPPAVRSSNGALRATLVAENGVVEVGEETVDGKPTPLKVAGTQTFAVEDAGQRGLLGPTLHVKPGEEVELTLDNRLTVPKDVPGSSATCAQDGKPMGPGHATHGGQGGKQLTNLHFHGLHVSPRERSPYGDTVLVKLKNGTSRFKFKIPEDHDQGTFWYHAHIHECTDDQVFRGLAGLLLIGDSLRDLPQAYSGVETRSLALKDVQLVANDDPDTKGQAQWKIDPGHFWGSPTWRTVNGLVNPVLEIRPGETQLWRLANVSAGVWYQVALVEKENDDAREELTVVAQDGNSLFEPQREKTLLIPPGARFDVLVRGPPSGTYVLKTFPFDQGFVEFPEDTLATVEVKGASAEPITAPLDLKPPPQRFPSTRGPERRFTFDIDRRDTEGSIGAKTFRLTINNDVFDPSETDVSPVFDTTERWILKNSSEEWHPFHIHQDDFRVVKAAAGGPSHGGEGAGVPPPPELPGDHDIVALPPGTPVKPSETVIDMPFTDFDGRFVFHCHILDHEDSGMMALVDLRRRGGG